MSNIQDFGIDLTSLENGGIMLHVYSHSVIGQGRQSVKLTSNQAYQLFLELAHRLASPDETD